MPFSPQITEKFAFGTTSLGGSASIADGLLIGVDLTIPGGSTDLQHIYPLDVSQVKLFAAECDRAITIETNSGSAPDNTLSLAAGVPYIWRVGKPDAFRLTIDVTSLFVTLAAGADATLKIQALIDSTP